MSEKVKLYRFCIIGSGFYIESTDPYEVMQEMFHHIDENVEIGWEYKEGTE
tara:strand:- start:6624 stop:6776 length:153 start_codon:yes stop_codon:yes gene_type:complete